jgi:chemotaxis protein MotB
VTIVRYLAEEEDIAPERLSAAGRAEFKPVAPNDSRENRALNRRADIVIIYPESSRQYSINLPQNSNTEGGSSEDTVDNE